MVGLFKRKSCLVSTNVEDGRRWRFDVRMVSRVFRETLIHLYSVVPAVQKKAIDDYGAWERVNDVDHDVARIGSDIPGVIGCYRGCTNVTEIDTAFVGGVDAGEYAGECARLG